MATYAIGDIQGCYDALLRLLEGIAFDPIKDHLWLAGDLVNRGPDSLKVLRFLKHLANPPVIVLGNHDLHLLAIEATAIPKLAKDTLDDILQAPDKALLCHWLRQQRLFYYDAKLGFAMAHAGIHPFWTLAQASSYAKEVETVLQSDQHRELFSHMYGDQPQCWHASLSGWQRLRAIINYFTRMRFCDEKGCLLLSAKGPPGSQAPGFYPWFALKDRVNKEVNILFGHWATLDGITHTPRVYALDTGCVWGKRLTALRLEDGTYFSVAC